MPSSSSLHPRAARARARSRVMLGIVAVAAVAAIHCDTQDASDGHDDGAGPTSSVSPTTPPNGSLEGGVSPGATGTPHPVGLRANNGKLVTAEGAGGGIVRADRPALREWETFTLFDLDASPSAAPRGGDHVRLRTFDGRHWWRAGASGQLLADGVAPDDDATFILERTAGSGDILRKTAVALRSHDGRYVTVDSAGTSELRSASTTIGPWETFTFELPFGDAAERHVTLRAHDGSYVAAEPGGASVTAPRKYLGATEKLTLIDLNGGTLQKGDRVYLESAGHRFLSAEKGGGAKLAASAAFPEAFETFTLTTPPETTTPVGADIPDGDSVSIAASSGPFVVAESGGGGVVNANRAAIGPWETFTLGFADRDPALVDTSTLLGKHVMGYQGWFAAPGDGYSNSWTHWFNGGGSAASATFDLWPDVSELGPGELFATDMASKSGGPAFLFSSQNETTVRRHFRWMKDAGIDGVALSRFVVATVGDTAQRQVRNVLAGAEEHGRTFFLWYDLTGSNPSTFANDLKADWTRLVKDVGATKSSRYLRHRGRPLVGMWGIGGPGPGTTAEILDLYDFFKNNADPSLRATIMAAGQREWRSDPTWGPIFRQAAVINPWTVGAYGDDAGADNYENTLQADVDDARSHDIDLLPVVWPGFSWHNLQKSGDVNAIPRRGGRFYWRQVHNAVMAGVPALFTAMFDECDEGTAMFKAAPSQSSTPTTGSFLTLDADGEALPSDWYLRLGGAASQALRGDGPNGSALPIKP